MSMFELSKNILQKVSFDRNLFQKEFIKAMKWLKPDEKYLLYAWSLSTFSQYKDIIADVFKTATRS